MFKLLKQHHHVISPARYRWRKQNYFSFAVMQLFDLHDPQKKFNQNDLWQLCGEVLKINQGEVFDNGLPKIRAEFLASGYCYAPKGQTVEKSFTRIQLADQKKTLVVFGNRQWHELGLTATVSKPKPFQQMPLTNQQAFGGKGYDLNPNGRGLGHVEPETPKQQLQAAPSNKPEFLDFPQKKTAIIDESAVEMFSSPLPNTEHPEHLILSKGDRPKPATYYPIALKNPVRLKKFGTYTQESLKKTGFYSYADDIDWHYFNNAADDQWLPEFLQGDEHFAIENMHPQLPLIQGQLPGWKIRCFFKQKISEEETRYDEIKMNLDTVWFIPHTMQGILIWHGFIPVQDLQASDLLALHIEDECFGEQPKPLSYYEDQFKKKTHRDDLETRMKKQTDQMAKKKADIIEDAQKKVKDASFLETEPFKSVIAKVQNSLNAHTGNAQALLAAPGLSGLPSIPQLSSLDLTAQIKQMVQSDPSAIEKQAQNVLSEFFQKAGIAYDKDASMLDNMKQIRKGIPQLVTSLLKPHQAALAPNKKAVEGALMQKAQPVSVDDTLRKFDEIVAILDNDAMLKQHLVAAGVRHNLEQAKDQIRKFMANINLPRIFSRADLEAAYANDESLAGQSLIDIDLSGINLSGANLKGVNFCYCNLSYANLSGAILTSAMLGYTNMSHVNAEKSNFFKAIFFSSDLTDANFHQADLSGCNFDSTTAIRANLSQANLTHAYIANADWSYVNMDQVDASSAKISDSKFHQANLNNINLDHASLNQVVFDDIVLSGAQLNHVNMQKSSFLNLSLPGFAMSYATISDSEFKELDFSQATLERTVFYKSIFTNIKCHKSNLKRTTIANSQVDQVEFYHCEMQKFGMHLETSLQNAYFETCDLSSSNFLNVRLIDVTFKRCDLQKSYFSDSHINSSHFLYCSATLSRFDNADLSNTRFYWTNLMKGSLRQTILVDAVFSHCNLYGIDFYHATTKQTVMEKCLMQDPLPMNFEAGFIHG